MTAALLQVRSGGLYRPSGLESGARTRRKRLAVLLLRPLQLSNERLFHEARHSETGEKKTTSRAFSIKLTGKTSPAPLWPSRAPFASFRRSSFAPSRREGHACLCVPLAQSVLPVPSRPRRRAFGRNLNPDREPRHRACKVLPVVVASIAFFGRRTLIEDHEQCRSTQGFSGATN